AKPGCRSRHNYNYWRHENYLSFGPSAHSFWRENGIARRWFNIANLSHYCSHLNENRLPLLTEEILTKEQLITERILLGLRSDGLNLKKLYNEFDVITPPQGVLRTSILRKESRRVESSTFGHHSIIPDLLEAGSVTLERDVLRLTRKGYLLCDEICARLLP
ncbi:MAG: hypothetical protein AAB344_06810, partial [Bacteroidota bacterium]